MFKYIILLSFIFLSQASVLIEKNNSTDVEIWTTFNETDGIQYSTHNITDDIMKAQVVYVSGKGVSSASLKNINNKTTVHTELLAEVLTPLQYTLKHKKHTRKDKLNEAAKHLSKHSKKSALASSTRWSSKNFTVPLHIKPSQESTGITLPLVDNKKEN